MEDRHEAMERYSAMSPWRPEAVELGELRSSSYAAAATEEQTDDEQQGEHGAKHAHFLVGQVALEPLCAP